MAKDFPNDQFDSVTAPGGRHRAKRTVRSRFGSFARYSVLSLALASLAIVALNFSSTSSQFGDILASSNNQAAGPSGFNAGGLGVTVIDSTDKKGLATKVGQSLFDAGWNVISAVNLNLIPLGSTSATSSSSGSATSSSAGSTTPPTATIVYATTTAAQSAAKDILKTIGNYKVQLSGAYVDPITVVIGSDYR